MTKLTSEYGFTKENVREEYMTQSKKAGVVRTLCLFLLLVGGGVIFAQKGGVGQPDGLYALSGEAEQIYPIGNSLSPRGSLPSRALKEEPLPSPPLKGREDTVRVDSVEQEVDSVEIEEPTPSPSLKGRVDSVLQEIDSVDVDSVEQEMDSVKVDSVLQEIDSVVEVDSVKQEVDSVEPVEYVDTVDVEEPLPGPLLKEREDSVGVDTLKQERMEKAVVALRTNMLYDAALIPNIGIEVKLGKGFTIGADWFGTWLFSDKKHIYWQCYGGYLTARYYWGKAAAEQPFTGHHVGIYGTALTYDVEFGGKGYQAAKFGFGGGVEYGYSLRVARSLCIDFNLGLGYQGGEYKVYMPTDDGTGHYVWMSTHMRHWWGPTKAEISLKWLIEPRVRHPREINN